MKTLGKRWKIIRHELCRMMMQAGLWIAGHGWRELSGWLCILEGKIDPGGSLRMTIEAQPRPPNHDRTFRLCGCMRRQFESEAVEHLVSQCEVESLTAARHELIERLAKVAVN